MEIDERVQENIESGNWEFSYSEIICPYCGYSKEVDVEMRFGDSSVEPYKEGDKDITCPECGHMFRLSKQLRWRYETNIVEIGRMMYMKGKRALDGKPFRYGGIMHNYDMTFDDWADVDEKAYGKCHICGGGTRSAANGIRHKTYPYCGAFKITRGRHKGSFRFKIMCRACAYDFGRGVVEADGNTYWDYYAFNEEKWRERKA